MPIAYSDTEIYDTPMDEAVAQLPESIRRVYIDTRDAPEDPEKPAGEFNPTDVVYPTPDYLNPPERPVTPSVERPPAKILFKTKTGVEITDHDIEDGFNVMMNAGAGTIESIKGPFKNYIDMFVKQPKVPEHLAKTFGKENLEKLAAPAVELDSTEKALKAIMEALDGPGAYEAKYGAEALKKAKTESDTPWTPETSPTYQKMLEKNPALKEGEAYLKQPTVEFSPAYLKDISPKEASEEYWKLLTTKGEYSAADFEEKYAMSQKGNGHEIFSEHVQKKMKENPYQQFPFEAKPEIQHHAPQPNVKGWPLDSKVTAEAYYELTNAGNYKEANKLYTDFLKEAKGQQIADFDIHLYKLEDKAKIANQKIVEKYLGDSDYVISAQKDAADAKLTYYDKVVNTIDEIQSKLFNKMLHDRAVEHYNKLQENLPGKAKEAGYDTVAFRGLKNRDEIKSIHNYDKTGVMYSSDSPLLADMYADYLSKHPGWSVKEGAFSEGATIAPMVINTKNYHVYDAKGSMWTVANAKAMAEARGAGKVGVIVKNVYDEPNSTKALGKPTTVYITFPKGAGTIKSRFAEKFNPESKDMLHLIPVIAVGGAAGYVSKAPDLEEKG